MLLTGGGMADEGWVRRYRGSIGRLVAASIFFLALMCADASAQVAGVLSWSAALPVDPAAGITAISCPTASLCVAVGGDDVATSSSPASGPWTVSRVDTATDQGSPASFQAVSCPAISLCVAVDTAGEVLTSTNPAGGPSTWQSVEVTPGYWLRDVSCPTVSLCLAVDNNGDVASSTNPTGGSTAWTVANVDSGPCASQVAGASCEARPAEGRPLEAVSCPSVSLCVAGDGEGDIVTSTNPTGGAGAWLVTYVDPVAWPGQNEVLQSRIDGVSCPTSSFCAATDDTGNVLTSQSPRGGATAWKVSARGGGTAVACPSVSRCLTAGYPEITESDEPLSGLPWTPELHDQNLSAIDCPSVVLCVAGDTSGAIAVAQARLLNAGALAAAVRSALLSATDTRVGALARTRTFALSFTAPSAGRIILRWATRSEHRRRLHAIAAGSETFATGGTRPLDVTLTAGGLRLLRNATHATITAQATFSAYAGPTVSVSHSFTFRP